MSVIVLIVSRCIDCVSICIDLVSILYCRCFVGVEKAVPVSLMLRLSLDVLIVCLIVSLHVLIVSLDLLIVYLDVMMCI